ncbi:MAG: DUF1353 domain-containing protein [Bacteroidota bacterium]|nr:DUF1353 domain-containing protein [Bacteroidota bacterium]
MSRFTNILVVSPLPDGKTWTIKSDFGYDVGSENSGNTINVPIGFQTDFASVPRMLWWLLPKWGIYGNAAVIHDYCYWIQHPYTRKQADEILKEAMIVLQTPAWQIFLIYWAVYLFGKGAWKKNSRLKKQGINRIAVQTKATEQRAW